MFSFAFISDTDERGMQRVVPFLDFYYFPCFRFSEVTNLSYFTVPLKDQITDRLLPPTSSVSFLWACFGQVLGDVSQTVSFFSYVLQVLFEILQLFLLIMCSTAKPLDLSGERRTLHSTPENMKTGCRLIQDTVIVLQHYISFCQQKWEKSMIEYDYSFIGRLHFFHLFRKNKKINK